MQRLCVLRIIDTGLQKERKSSEGKYICEVSWSAHKGNANFKGR